MPANAITPEAILHLLHAHAILGSEEPATAQSDLFALGLDSLAMMQLLLHIEREFHLRIPAAEITRERFSTPLRLSEWLLTCSQ
jgi:acyl carrier protein